MAGNKALKFSLSLSLYIYIFSIYHIHMKRPPTPVDSQFQSGMIILYHFFWYQPKLWTDGPSRQQAQELRLELSSWDGPPQAYQEDENWHVLVKGNGLCISEVKYDVFTYLFLFVTQNNNMQVYEDVCLYHICVYIYCCTYSIHII